METKIIGSITESIEVNAHTMRVERSLLVRSTDAEGRVRWEVRYQVSSAHPLGTHRQAHPTKKAALVQFPSGEHDVRLLVAPWFVPGGVVIPAGTQVRNVGSKESVNTYVTHFAEVTDDKGQWESVSSDESPTCY